MNFSDSFLEPVFAKTMPPLVVIKVKVGRNLKQVLAREDLGHTWVVKLNWSRPYVISVIQNHEEGVIAASEGIEGLPREVEFVDFSFEAFGRDRNASTDQDVFSIALCLSFLAHTTPDRILSLVISRD